ncbi:MAG: hypothetical protein ACI4LN_04715, partial [Anaerovoracaceae bacterium]
FMTCKQSIVVSNQFVNNSDRIWKTKNCIGKTESRTTVFHSCMGAVYGLESASHNGNLRMGRMGELLAGLDIHHRTVSVEPGKSHACRYGNQSAWCSVFRFVRDDGFFPVQNPRRFHAAFIWLSHDTCSL